MASLAPTPPILTDRWVQNSWEDYLGVVADPRYGEARCYYNDGEMRVEMVA